MRNGTVRMVAANLFVLAAFGQSVTLQKEYVYLGSRVIAVESPAATFAPPTVYGLGNPTNLTGQPPNVDHTATIVVKGTSTGGGSYIDYVEGIFTPKTVPDVRYGCYFFAISDGSIYLGTDSGVGWVSGSGAKPGSSVTLSNSSCSITLNNTASVAVSGNDLVVTLPIAFKPIFAGAQNLLLLTADKGTPPGSSGWVQVPGYTLTAHTAPVVTFGKSLTSTNTDGTAAVFTYTFTNTGALGADYIAAGNLLWNRTTYDSNFSCFIIFNRADNSFYMPLTNQAGAAGSGGTLNGTHCSLNLAASSIILTNINTLTVTASVTFKQPNDFSPPFRGLMGSVVNFVELFNRAGQSDSPTSMPNTFKIRPNPTSRPTTPSDAVIPTNWVGTSQQNQQDGTRKQTFTFKMDHAFSGRYFDWMQVSFNDPGRCYFFYSNVDDFFALATSAGGQWYGFQFRGSGPPLDNGACRINQDTVLSTQVVRNTTSLSLTMDINFYQPLFVGPQAIRMYGGDRSGNDSPNPWAAVGTVTVW